MVCQLCKEFCEKYPPKDGFHDISEFEGMEEIKCAFTSNLFSSDNWNCMTLNALRDISYKDGFENDQSYTVLKLKDELLFLFFYKNRGKTDSVLLINSHGGIDGLTLDKAQEILRGNTDGNEMG